MTSEQKGIPRKPLNNAQTASMGLHAAPVDAQDGGGKPSDAEMVEVMRDAINQFYGSIEISRSALEAALQALREKGMI